MKAEVAALKASNIREKEKAAEAAKAAEGEKAAETKVDFEEEGEMTRDRGEGAGEEVEEGYCSSTLERAI